MALTAKQEAFCLAVLTEANASDAYRTAYSAAKMSPGAVSVAAKLLMDDPKISLRVAELRAPAIEKAQITLELHLNDLKSLRDKADAAEKYGPAITAEIARGKASGLYVEKIEHSGTVGVADAIRQTKA